MVRAVLADAIPVEQLAEHLFVAAALQVHFARQAARLNGKGLVPVGDGACPACGGATGRLDGGGLDRRARHALLRLLAMQQPNGTTCASNARCAARPEGIGYRTLKMADRPGASAETCESCRGYVKILQQLEDPALDPIADDVASLALDLLVREAGIPARRASIRF